MANTNISHVQLVNTFNEWRAATNDLIEDRNILRNAPYVKDGGSFDVANGSVTISRSSNGTVLTIANSGNVAVGGWVNANTLATNSELWLGPRAGDFAGVIKMNQEPANSIQAGNATWYSANQRSNNPYYGFTFYSNGTMVLANEEATATQVLVIGDSAYNVSPTRHGTIFGVSTIIGTSTPTTGYESDWQPVLDLRSNSFFVMPVGNANTGNSLFYNVTTGEITYGVAPGSNLEAGGTITGDIVITGNLTVQQNSTIRLKAYKDYILENTNVGAANTLNLNDSNWFKYTLTGSSGNRQMTFNNAPASGNGFTFTMIILQDGTGGKTPTWANTIYWAGGQVPPATTDASARDLWTFTTYDGGSTYIGTLAVKDAK